MSFGAQVTKCPTDIFNQLQDIVFIHRSREGHPSFYLYQTWLLNFILGKAMRNIQRPELIQNIVCTAFNKIYETTSHQPLLPFTVRYRIYKNILLLLFKTLKAHAYICDLLPHKPHCCLRSTGRAPLSRSRPLSSRSVSVCAFPPLQGPLIL